MVFSRPGARACLMVLVFAWTGVSAAQVRTWTDRTGQLHVEAELVGRGSGRVWLRGVDGETFEVRLEELSPQDRDYVEALGENENQEAVASQNRPGAISYGAPRKLAELANRRINESSGLAPSRRTPGMFWTHNDSGDDARLYALDRQGRDLGSCRLKGVLAYDWEDIASFRWKGKSYLLVCDVGNNGRAAAVQMLHVIEEPAVDGQRGVTPGVVPVLQTIFYSYEDDHRDCEAVAVDPTDRTVLLVTKELDVRSYVYALAWPETPTKKALVARRIATVPVGLVTGMDIAPDGRRAILVTYLNAYEFTRQPGEPWGQAFARPPRGIVMPPRVQGESICYGPDGKTLYLTSEKLPTPLWEVPVRSRSEAAD